MNLLLVRDVWTDQSTAGKLSIDGRFECWTLERPDHHGLIPEGRYQVKPYHSPKFACVVPILCDVPHRAFIEIHPGNTARDSEGCILVGSDRLDNMIGRAVFAFGRLMAPLEREWNAGGEVWIEVRSETPPLQAVA